jgi:hypothetical protein
MPGNRGIEIIYEAQIVNNWKKDISENIWAYNGER